MPSANIYLNFDGNCEEAFEFYRSVFGGEFPYVGRYKDMPPQEGMPSIPEEMGNKIMHMSLELDGDTALMGSDAGGDWAPDLKLGNNFAVSVNADSKENADQIFSGLSAGGTVTMPMNMTFWGSYFGMFTDKFGVNWMVSFGSAKEE